MRINNYLERVRALVGLGEISNGIVTDQIHFKESICKSLFAQEHESIQRFYFQK